MAAWNYGNGVLAAWDYGNGSLMAWNTAMEVEYICICNYGDGGLTMAVKDGSMREYGMEEVNGMGMEVSKWKFAGTDVAEVGLTRVIPKLQTSDWMV